MSFPVVAGRGGVEDDEDGGADLALAAVAGGVRDRRRAVGDLESSLPRDLDPGRLV